MDKYMESDYSEKIIKLLLDEIFNLEIMEEAYRERIIELEDKLGINDRNDPDVF